MQQCNHEVPSWDDVHKDEYGTDNGHEFRVVKTRDSEVCIEYLSDGKRAWFQDNRFERTDDGLILN